MHLNYHYRLVHLSNGQFSHIKISEVFSYKKICRKFKQHTSIINAYVLKLEWLS